MSRIQIKDLTADETLDLDALKRVRGGTLNFAGIADGAKIHRTAVQQDISVLKIDGGALNFIKIDDGGALNFCVPLL